MSDIMDFIGGDGLQIAKNKVIFENDGTYTAPYTGDYYILCVGGGGGAGDQFNDYWSKGAFAGEVKFKKIKLIKDEQIDISVGTGGAGGTAYDDGESGGATSFGSYLTANGGAGTQSGNDRGEDPDILKRDTQYLLPRTLLGFEENPVFAWQDDNREDNQATSGENGFGGVGGLGGKYSTAKTSIRNGQGWGAGGGGAGGDNISGNDGGNGYQGVCIIGELR